MFVVVVYTRLSCSGFRACALVCVFVKGFPLNAYCVCCVSAFVLRFWNVLRLRVS